MADGAACPAAAATHRAMPRPLLRTVGCVLSRTVSRQAYNEGKKPVNKGKKSRRQNEKAKKVRVQSRAPTVAARVASGGLLHTRSVASPAAYGRAPLLTGTGGVCDTPLAQVEEAKTVVTALQAKLGRGTPVNLLEVTPTHHAHARCSTRPPFGPSHAAAMHRRLTAHALCSTATALLLRWRPPRSAAVRRAAWPLARPHSPLPRVAVATGAGRRRFPQGQPRRLLGRFQELQVDRHVRALPRDGAAARR